MGIMVGGGMGDGANSRRMRLREGMRMERRKRVREKEQLGKRRDGAGMCRGGVGEEWLGRRRVREVAGWRRRGGEGGVGVVRMKKRGVGGWGGGV